MTTTSRTHHLPVGPSTSGRAIYAYAAGDDGPSIVTAYTLAGRELNVLEMPAGTARALATRLLEAAAIVDADNRASA